MPLEAKDVHAAIRHALAQYEGTKMGQTWLKPTCVLAIDLLVPCLVRPYATKRPFLCLNAMNTERRGEAWKWRRDIYENAGGAYLSNMTLYRHECLVDMNLMIGASDPYETLLTAESEGHSAHGRTVGQVSQATDNDFLWDFYKLLQIPSPVRLMFTVCAKRYQGALVDRLDQLVKRYATLPQQLAPETDIWSVSFPTSSMVQDHVRIHRWAPGQHMARPVDHPIIGVGAG